MSSKTKLDNQKFIQYCQSTLSAAVFNSLSNKIGACDKTVKKYLNEPNTMPYTTLKAFARMLKVNPLHLYFEYEAGMDRITAREYEDMIADHMSDYNAVQRQKEAQEEFAYTGVWSGYLNKLKEYQ